MSEDFNALRVQHLQPVADDALLIGFEVPAALAGLYAFIAGQHLTLRQVIDGVERRRSYSICAAPHEGVLRVGVRKVPGGTCSSWLHANLRVGDSLDVMRPAGRFVFAPEPGARQHLLAIAAGSGITPILSILKTLLAHEPRSRCTLIYGNRTVRSTMFREELEDLKNRHLTRLALHLVYSQEQVDSALHRGRLDAARVARFLQTLVDVRRIDNAYLCGPHGMNDDARTALLAAGMPHSQVHIERYGVPDPAVAGAGDTPAAGPAPADAEQAVVSIIRDGLRRDVPYRRGAATLLDAAMQAGMDLPYSCRSGVCCTCRARLLEGRVRMERNFSLEQADLDAGFVLTCQAHPLTSRVVVSFDAR